MAGRFWRSNAIPWTLMTMLLAAWVALPYACAQATSTPDAQHPDRGAIAIPSDLAFLIGVVTTVAGAALGYGMAWQKLRAHCDDETKHVTMEIMRKAFMSREEVKLLARTIVQEVLLKHQEDVT